MPPKFFALACLLAATALDTGCAQAPRPVGPGTSAVAEAPPQATPGHLRMLELLEQAAEQSRGENPYMGEEKVRRMQVELAAVPDEPPDMRRWFFNLRLGRDTLRLGRIEQAIAHYASAYELLEHWGEEIPLDQQLRTMYEFGAAYLRLGETRNCVARHTSESCLLPIRGAGVHVDQDGARRAAALFLEVLERAPLNSPYAIRARWLLNITAMVLGTYPAGVPPNYRIDPAAFESAEAFPRLVDVAPQLGLNELDLAGSVVIDDFDADGLLDIVTSTSDPWKSLRYYRNEGDGTFRDRTAEAGFDGLWGGLNLNHADYDNDGDPDLFVLRGAWWRAEGRLPNSLLRNDGTGRFLDVTFEAGLGEVHYPTQTAGWADFDNDGDLDLYVGNESDTDVTAPGQLFRNRGDGTFEDIASAAGVENLRYAKSVAWGDYDADRDPDLYVSNMGHDNRLYRNDGDGTFTDVAPELGVTGPTSSFPCWFWDYDNDGVLDLFVAAYGGPQQAPDVADVAASYMNLRSRGEADRLYRGGAGGFRDEAAAAGLDRYTLPMGANFGDLDNDGFLDFYLGTGYPLFEGLMPNLMFVNRGGRRFVDVTTAAGLGHLQKGHGIAFADLDSDGDQDLFSQLGGMYPGDAFGAALFENPGNDRHWVKLSLIGTRSNRSALGARVRATVVEHGVERTLHRWIGSGGSFGSNPFRLELGLGAADRVRTLEVYWPTSDLTQRFEGVLSGRWIEIVEGQEAYRELALRPAPFRAAPR